MNNNFDSKNYMQHGPAWQTRTEDMNKNFRSNMDTDASVCKSTKVKPYDTYEHLRNRHFDHGSIWLPDREDVSPESVTSSHRDADNDIATDEEYNNRYMDDSNNFPARTYSRRFSNNETVFNNIKMGNLTNRIEIMDDDSDCRITGSTFSKISSAPISNNEYNNRNMENNSNRRICTKNSNDWLDNNLHSLQKLRNTPYNRNNDNFIDESFIQSRINHWKTGFTTEYNDDYQMNRKRNEMQNPIDRWVIDNSNRRMNNQSPNNNEYNNKNKTYLPDIEMSSLTGIPGAKYLSCINEESRMKERNTRLMCELETRRNAMPAHYDRIMDDLIDTNDTKRRLRENKRHMVILLEKMEKYKNLNSQQPKIIKTDNKSIFKNTIHQPRNLSGHRDIQRNQKPFIRKNNRSNRSTSAKTSLSQKPDDRIIGNASNVGSNVAMPKNSSTRSSTANNVKIPSKPEGLNALPKHMRDRLQKNLLNNITDNLRVSIVNGDTGCEITDAQSKIVIDNLHKFMIRNIQNGKTGQLAFFSPKLVSGKIEITCVNGKSVRWLAFHVPQLGKLWPDADLKLIATEYILANVFVPDAISKYTDVIERLQSQNKNIKTDLWKLCRRKKINNGQLHELSIDLESWKVIEAADYHLFYNLGKIEFVFLDSIPKGKHINSK